MPDQLGRQAVVIGAGMAGMPAARVLADHFERVVVVENDALPVGAAARPGTPQARHLHVLLAGGQRALSSLFPGFDESLVAAGARKLKVAVGAQFEFPGFDVFPKRDLGFPAYCMTRPLLESVVRKHFAQIANVTTHQCCRAQRLITSADGSRVTGISCVHADRRNEEIEAELVVDASSNGHLTLNLLEVMGIPAPEETSVRVEIGYASGIFDIPADALADWQVAVTFPDPPKNRRGAFVIPIEGDHWMVGLQGSHDAKPPEDEAGFLEFARQLRTPTIYNAIRNATLCTPIHRYGFKASRWRHFEKMEKFPAGLIPFGDTICRFNPVYGQGMSVAAKEACLLRDLLQAADTEGRPLDSLPSEFLAQAQHVIDAPWAMAVVPDFIDPLTEGERPEDLENALRFGAALRQLAFDDAEIHKVMMEVQHMIKPRTVLHEPEIVERVKAVMAQA